MRRRGVTKSLFTISDEHLLCHLHTVLYVVCRYFASQITVILIDVIKNRYEILSVLNSEEPDRAVVRLCTYLCTSRTKNAVKLENNSKYPRKSAEDLGNMH